MSDNKIPIDQRPPIDITDPEYQIRQVEATMAMEGFILTEENKQVLRDINNGKLTPDEAIAEIKRKYKAGDNSGI